MCSLDQWFLMTLFDNLTLQELSSSLASSLSSKSLVFLDPEAVDHVGGGVSSAAGHVKSVPMLNKRNAMSGRHLRKAHSHPNQRVVLKSVLFNFPYNW